MDDPGSVVMSSYKHIGQKNTEACLGYIKSLVNWFKPDCFILESEESRRKYRSSSSLDSLHEMEHLIQLLGLPIRYVSRDDIRRTFSVNRKEEVTRELLKIFPQFVDRAPKERKYVDSGESTRQSQFDALSLGYAYFKQG